MESSGPERIEALWKELMAANPSNESLCQIIESVPSLRVEATKWLLVQHPSCAELRCMLEFVPEARLEIMQVLLFRRFTSSADISFILQHFKEDTDPEIHKTAAHLLPQREKAEHITAEILALAPSATQA